MKIVMMLLVCKVLPTQMLKINSSFTIKVSQNNHNQIEKYNTNR